MEPTPQSPHIARPLGFQLGWAAVRNEEWARPKFGDVRWKLVLLGQPVQLCVSHSLHLAIVPGGYRPSLHRLLFRAVPTEPPALEEQPGEPLCVSDSFPSVIPCVSLGCRSHCILLPGEGSEVLSKGLASVRRVTGCARVHLILGSSQCPLPCTSSLSRHLFGNRQPETPRLPYARSLWSLAMLRLIFGGSWLASYQVLKRATSHTEYSLC